MRVEIGAGEKPSPDYEVHTDVLPLPGIQVLCRLDRLPFADASVSALRANHVLEHQSFQLVGRPCGSGPGCWSRGRGSTSGCPTPATSSPSGWRAVLDPGGELLAAGRAHGPRRPQGADERGVPRWIWNAHHAMFDDAWLAQVLAANGFTDIDISCYDVRNLRCYCRRAAR